MKSSRVESPERPSNLKELQRRERESKALPPPSHSAAGRKRHRIWPWLLVFGVLGFAGYRYYQTKQQQQRAAQAAEARLANRAMPVAATPVRRGDMPVYLHGLGTVTAYNTVNVKSRVDGPIIKVNFIEGQHVHAGEVLVEIDPRPYQVALEQAEGQKARDEAQMKDAQVNLARYQTLWQEGVIAKQQFDTQAATVGQFQGSIQADQAAIDNARLNLSFTKVTAPIDGRIGLRQVDIGNIVHASDPNPLAIITQMQPIAVLFTIPSDNLQPVMARLRAGAKLPVQAYDRADRNIIATGTLETVDNEIDVSTGTSRLKAVFANTDEALFPNQFVNARLLLNTLRNVVMIPAAAVQQGPEGAYVYVVNPNHTATMRRITEGITEGSTVQITSGLAPGELVVTDGQDKLQEGSKVQVTSEGSGDPLPGGGTPSGSPGRDFTGTAMGTGGPLTAAGRAGQSGRAGQGVQTYRGARRP